METELAGFCLRVSRGLPLYTPPSLEYVFDDYAPLYFWLCGVLVHFFGQPLLVCRVVSLAATVATAAAITAIPRRSPRGFRWFLGLCFLAYFAAGAQWFDLARIDMLALAWMAWGCALAIRGRRAGSAVAAGVLLAMAVLTKQNCGLVVLVMAIAAGLHSRSRGLLIGAAGLLIPVVVFGALHAASDGWSTHYAFLVGLLHPFLSESVFFFLESDLGGHASIMMLVVCAAFLTVRAGRGRSRRRRAWPPLLLAVGGLLAMLPIRLKWGGAANHRLMLWCGLLMAVAWSVPPLLAALGRMPRRRPGVTALFWCAMLGVSATLTGTYFRIWMDRGLYLDRMEGRKKDIAVFHERLRSVASLGPIWVPSHTYCPHIPEQRYRAANVPINCLRDSRLKPSETMFYQSMKRTLASPDRPVAVVLNSGFNAGWAEALRHAGYVDMGSFLPADTRCRSLSGFITYPARWFVHSSRVQEARRFSWAASAAMGR